MKDPKNDKEPGAGLLFLAVPLMMICCAGPALLAGGALTAFFAWLADGGLVTIGLAAIVGVLAVGAFRRVSGRRRKHVGESASIDR